MKTSEPQNPNLDNDGSTSSETQTSVVENDLETSAETSSHLDRPRRPWLWLLIALVLLGGGFAGWRLLKPKTEAPSANANQPQGTRVKLAPVQTATIEESSNFIANLESRRSVTLRPRIQGQVSRIFVTAGDEVAAEKPIIQVDPREQQASVSSVNAAAQGARAEVENARATLRSLEAQRNSNLSNLKLNQQEYERYSSLAEQGAVPRQVLDQYLNRLEAAQASLGSINNQIQAQKAAVARAEKALQQAEANTREQQVQLQYYTISAPFAGAVGDIPVKVGDFVNTSTQLTTITQNRPLQVNISVPIERAPELRLGMPVDLINAQGRNVGTSRVFFISPNVNTSTQSVLIKSLFDNPMNQLRADQFVRAKVIWDKRPGVLIPTTAVTRLGGETFVYVATQGQSQQGQSQLVARQKPVELGAIQGNNYQVLEGLQPGERIVVSGLLNLRDGAAIIPE